MSLLHRKLERLQAADLCQGLRWAQVSQRIVSRPPTLIRGSQATDAQQDDGLRQLGHKRQVVWSLGQVGLGQGAARVSSREPAAHAPRLRNSTKQSTVLGLSMGARCRRAITLRMARSRPCSAGRELRGASSSTRTPARSCPCSPLRARTPGRSTLPGSTSCCALSCGKQPTRSAVSSQRAAQWRLLARAAPSRCPRASPGTGS